MHHWKDQRVAAERKAAPRSVCWCIAIVVSGIAASWLLDGNLRASDATPATRPFPDHPVLRETKRILRVRQALFEDPLLAPYNLGVEVRENVAILSGTLPNVALVSRAQERVQTLGLFMDVRSELVVDPQCDQPKSLPLVTPSESDSDALISIVNPRPRPPSELTGRKEEPVRIPALKPPIAETPGSGDPAPSKPLNEAVTLLPPRPIAAATSSPTVSGAEILPPRPIPPTDSSQAVEELRVSEARYRALQVSVRQGVVTIRGNSSGGEMFAFAQAVRTLPGVVRVVLESNPYEAAPSQINR